MSLSFYIAKRYFFSRKGGSGLNLISVISGISLLGYMVGAAALIIVLSVFNGFEALFTSLYSNFDSDLKIVPAQGKVIRIDSFNWDALRKERSVAAFCRVVEENVLLRYNNQQTIATLKGVDSNYAAVTGFDSVIVHGVVDIRHQEAFAVVGQGIAYRLSVDPDDLYKALSIYVPKRHVETFLRPDEAFNKAVIRPEAVFSVQEEVDDKYVVCPLAFSMELLEKSNEISAIEVKLAEGDSPDRVKKRLQEEIGPHYTIRNRFEQHESFYKVMRSEKTVSYIILLFILLIAASNTISSLYILLVQKKRDLYILKSMGLDEQRAASVFRYEGLIMSVTGGGVGILLGLLLCWLQDEYAFVSLSETSDVIFSAYPVKVLWSDVLLVFATVVALGYITTLYPSRKARQLMR